MIPKVHCQWHGDPDDQSGVGEFYLNERPGINIDLTSKQDFYILSAFIHRVALVFCLSGHDPRDT